MAYTVGCLITVTPSESEVALCEITCSSNLVDTSSILLLCGKNIVGNLEVVDNLLEELLIGKLVVAGLLLCIVLIHFLVDPRNLTEHCQKLEIEVSTQETDLSIALLCSLGTKFVLTIFSYRNECTVAA